MEKLAWELMLQTCTSLFVDDPSRRPASVSAADRRDSCSEESGVQGLAGTRRGRKSVDSPAPRPSDGGERPGPTDDARDHDEFGDLG